VIAAEMISAGTELELAPLIDVFNVQIGYATPRIDVRGAVFRADQLLLVRERADDGWTLPGGWVDVGDIPSEAVEREVWEEAGFRVRARRVIGIYDANRVQPMELFHAFKIVFLCDLIGGEARTSNETSEVKFFGLKELPSALSGERTQPRHLADAFKFLADDRLSTVFD
jgi:ADP-ribose pyrophosphatase YjhB (NUDIX family)